MITSISRFHRAHRFLSNFYVSRVQYDGHSYITVEHAYQAAKCVDQYARDYIRDATTPADAKTRGRASVIRQDWDQVKIVIMLDLLTQKFQVPFLASLLRDTGDAKLIEGNTWHDQFWGTCFCEDCEEEEGQNWLGKLLMEVRDGLV